MLRINGVRVGFLLGVSLLLAAIIYFFAANWSALDRMEKIVVSAGFVLLFYGVSYALTRFRFMPDYHAFLSNVLLVGGCISFGAAVALLGQIYNSHADSYGLFLIWSIPAILLAWITRYNPLYVLSYTLIHLSLLLYFFPSSIYVVHTDAENMLIGGLFALINLLLFIFTEYNRLVSAPLKFLSFIIFHISLLLITNSVVFGHAGAWMNIPWVIAIAFGFYYFLRIRLNKTYLTLNALAASAFAVFKFIELAVEHASSAFYFFGLVFVALLLTGNVLFFRYLNKLSDPPLSASPMKAGEDQPKEPTGERSGVMVGRVVSTIVTVIGVIIGTISLVGLVVLASGTRDPQYTLYGLSLLFVLPMVLLPRLNPVIRYTVLTIGYIAGMISIVWMDLLGLSALFILTSIAGWIRLEGTVQRLFTYALFNLNLGIVLFQLLDPQDDIFSFIILTLAVLNAALYASHLLLREGPMRRHIRIGGLFFTLLFLFWLTFFDDIFPYSYELFNVINLGFVSYLVFRFLHRSRPMDTAISLAFWFVYIAFKYYDLLWSLLHKSVTLALLGIIALTVTYTVALRTDAAKAHGENNSLIRKSTLLVALVVVLQLGFLGYQTVSSESLLRTGASIKLQIEPLDPRSLLQGDYIILNYSISTPPLSVAEELEASRSLSKVKVVLAPDDRGIHVFKRLYKKGEALADGEVVVNGTWNGGQSIHYGIESYFVPEGTGLDVERDAKFAYIRVSTNGNALLERLTKE